jgi:glycosyltransferase involved in cell wall biosynthesis
MKVNIIENDPSVVVITPTVGKKSLEEAINSVQSQTYKGTIEHLIVVDGSENLASASLHIPLDKNIHVTSTPYNVGANGMYGHRIYASYPHLVDQDYVIFLDDDNWFEPHHIDTLVNLIQKENLDWAYSLRCVYENGNFLDYDRCESIGKWPIWFTQDTPTPGNLVDTSSFCFKREFLIQCCHLWHYGWGGDRRFYSLIKEQSKHNTTGKHTLNYNLPDMDRAYGGDREFFKKGNEAIKKKYGGYPWEL